MSARARMVVTAVALGATAAVACSNLDEATASSGVDLTTGATSTGTSTNQPIGTGMSGAEDSGPVMTGMLAEDSGAGADATDGTTGPGPGGTSTGMMGDSSTGPVNMDPLCGNGILEGTEQCDGADFGGWSCANEGDHYGGTPVCTGSCTIDAGPCCQSDGGYCNLFDDDCCSSCNLFISQCN